MTNSWRKYVVPWLGFLIALGMHLWQLDQPPQLVSDEVFFVNDGYNYVLGHPYFDPHPPLGKEQLGTVFTLFGFTPLTWRILNAIEGALLVPLLWWLAWRFTRNRVAANLGAALVLLDGLTLVESRLGLINIPYILYGLTALGCTLKGLEVRRPGWWLLAAGVMIGAAVSVKWLALLMTTPTILLWIWPKLFGQTKNPEQPLWTWLTALGGLIFLPAVIYWLVFLRHFGWLGVTDTFFKTNAQMLNYHLSVPSHGGLYAQPWWGWLLLWKPFVYWAQPVGSSISAIVSLPNPWVWWTGAMFLLYSLVRGWRDPVLRGLNLFLLFAWIPFVFIQRIMYSYHAMPFGLFLTLLASIILSRVWGRHRRWVVSYVVVAGLIFVWFLPWYLSFPLSHTEHQLRRWLPSWQLEPR
ncbi:MAG: phospholipid carrier-dependent glycosyltransferase [Candidatus Kerfeldbacteria bacterium]|nr:phospholipid carrier-dependent glycosyltransferase [Candidatus Kerfeldbacteria bacterium]